MDESYANSSLHSLHALKKEEERDSDPQIGFGVLPRFRVGPKGRGSAQPGMVEKNK